MNTTKGQESIANNAMQQNTKLAEKHMDNNNYMLIILFVLIGVVVLLVILSFLNKGPKTVYLKPKDSNDNQSTNAESEMTDTQNTSSTSQTGQSSDSISQTMSNNPTGAYKDDSVIKSELKNIRQSAVKMSVGQKQGASQIVKDWLDDGGETADDNKQDETEE